MKVWKKLHSFEINKNKSKLKSPLYPTSQKHMGVPPDVTLQLAFSWQVRLPQGSARLMLQVAPVYPAGHAQDMDDPVAVHTPPFEQGAGTALQGS